MFVLFESLIRMEETVFMVFVINIKAPNTSLHFERLRTNVQAFLTLRVAFQQRGT